MKIKAIPVKSSTLCEKCYFNSHDHCRGRHENSCRGCPLDKGVGEPCKCAEIKIGEPCKFFISKEKVELIEQKAKEAFGLTKEKIRKYFKVLD